MKKTQAQKVYGTGAVAELLGMPRWRLIQLLEMRKLPEPAIQVPGRRLFTQEDVERIRRAMNSSN